MGGGVRAGGRGVAAAWLLPTLLVYCHPLIALWLLARELRRSHRSWLPAYRWRLLLDAGAVRRPRGAALGSPPLPGTDPITETIARGDPMKLTDAITRHSGGGSIPWVSNRLLVTLHTFLELVHYGVWVILMPLIGMRSAPWDTGTIPAARRGGNWKRGVVALLCFGLLLVAVLWVAFVADYTTTRTVYFTVALLHVLAEVPFLLRML